MDYKEKYNKALERAKKGLPIDEVFPELKESKDERIKRALLELVSYDKANGYTEFYEERGITCDDAIAYLERLKEQKPVHTAKEMWKEMRLEVYAQASGNRHEPNYSDDSTKMFSLCDIDEIFEKIGDSTVGSQSAEWSEEDERTLESFLGWLQGSMGEKTYSSWLKSLPERFSLKPKQEWGENDEFIFNAACNALETHGHTKLSKMLKSLLSRPKSSGNWKPSEEQMRAVFDASERNDKLGSVLLTLYNDLKKLL